MKRLFYILIIAGMVNSAEAQKLIKKSLVREGVRLFQIDTAQCFEVVLHTTERNEVVVEASMDGEYSKDLLVNIKEEGSTLSIASGFQPNFKNPNDKLSAHKVISIALHIYLPEYRKVKVYGTSSNVTVNGKYAELDITLSDGRCVLKDVGLDVNVTSSSGDIEVFSGSGMVEAFSKFGAVNIADIPAGDNRFHLNTTTGNIILNKPDKL